MSISLLANLEKITATRDFASVEHSLLKAIGSTVHVDELSLWSLDSRYEVTKVLHYHRLVQVREGGMERETEHIDTVYTNIEVAPDYRSLAETVVLSKRSAARKRQDGTLHMFPVVSRKAITGIVSMQVRDELTEQDRALIHGILGVYANYYALLDESQRDRLTGLYNRHAMDLNIERMWSLLGSDAHRADPRRNGVVQVHGLAIIDIDHFKKVNDQYGHILGDEILLLVSRLISSCFRRRDPVYRYGGEEFLVVAGAESPPALATLFERVRAKVEAHYFPQVDKVTVSIGYVNIDPGLSPFENIGRADRALYCAKERGRNQVQSFDDLREQGLIKEMRYGSTELF
ncbi:MAG: GGDEF domain-containing protein [Rhodoferax sp.]|nr:GGDEF domain-containing protein [Rhodoferax sp.]